MTRFTPLESDVLDALAWDLRDIAPDLAGQFAESLPGGRRNTGSGLFTELIVDRDRPPPLTSPTGRFGTVHAMVGDLPDPIAFQVELRQGRLLFLHGDAYGQDTRALDFARIPYDQIFTVDARGESVAFDPAALMPDSPLLDLHAHNDHDISDPPPTSLVTGQRVQDPGPQDIVALMFGAVERTGSDPAPDEGTPDKADQISLQIGLWVIIAILALFATLVMRLPILFAVFLAVGLGRVLHKPKVMSALARATRQLGRYEYRPPQQ